MKELDGSWTVEVNADEDPLDPCSWHITEYRLTIKTNLSLVVDRLGRETQPWLLIAVCKTFEDACVVADTARALIRKIKKVKKELGEMTNGSNNKA